MFQNFSPRALLIENDATLAEQLLHAFEREGYLIKWYPDALQAYTDIGTYRPHLVILNRAISGLSALDLCQRLRADLSLNDMKIIMISDNYSESDAVRSLSIGADDYMVKPFSTLELIARAWAHLRPFRMQPTEINKKKTARKIIRTKFPPIKDSVRLEFSGIMVDTDRYIASRDGIELKIRIAEFRLLAILIERPGKVFTREELINRLWEQSELIDARTIDVMIGRLRKDLTRHNKTNPIESVRGVGYALRGGGETDASGRELQDAGMRP